jgi:hypothetical protein
MAPASVVLRLTEQLCPGYEQYHFTVRRDPATNERVYGSKVVTKLLAEEPVLPRSEFFIGGEIVEALPEKDRKTLEDGGATLDEDPRRLLAAVAERAFGPATRAGG